MKKLLVVISCLTLFMVAHATVKEVAVDYHAAEILSPGKGGTGCLTDIVQRYDYTYDHADRQKTVSHRLNSGAQALLSHSAYNSIGRQSAITTGLISTNYQYDVHGWLSGISNSRFSQTLQYADGAAPCYNGNISSNLWQDNQGTMRRYDYSYDGLNRLVNASYTETRQSLPQGLAISGTPDYSAMYEYDLNGNATFIRRNGISRKTGNSLAQTWAYDVIDNIYIEYDGNQPLFVDDTQNPLLYENAPGCNDSSFEAEEFAWDANGNMTQDLTKGITSITYNMLNLPSVITYGDGHKEYRYYDTDGNRLRTLYQVAITPASSSASAYARYRTEQTRHYCGDVEYVNDSVARVLTPVGYVNARGNNAATLGDYRFYIRDYQGNNRVLVDYSGNAIERYDYYPYGGLFGEVNPEQWRLYGGKELQSVNGLNLHDFHARWQDYATCQFTTQDPLAEKYHALSPYIYCAGNPIMLTDPSGMEFTQTATKYAKILIEQSLQRIVDSMISNTSKFIIGTGNTSHNVINHATDAIKEIIELEQSNQLYDVVEDTSLPTKSPAETRANSENETIEIALKDMDSPIDLIAHEFKHLSQFEKGEISFTDKNAKAPHFLYDQTDEVAAYNRGAIFGGPKYDSVDKLPTDYKKFPEKKMDINIFIKTNYPYTSGYRNINGILTQQLKYQKQSYRYKGKTYLYIK